MKNQMFFRKTITKIQLTQYFIFISLNNFKQSKVSKFFNET